MNIPNLSNIKHIYNTTMSDLLNTYGLGVPCDLIYKSTKKIQCYNCFYDSISNKSANRFKQLNAINYNRKAIWNSPTGGVISVGTSGKPSAYGTYDQSGNCWEWLDNIAFGSFRICRSGAWNSFSVAQTSKTSRAISNSFTENEIIGFRICSSTNIYNYSSFVPVATPLSNNPDISGYGSVNYAYLIGKFEITNAQYCEFLNLKAKTDTYNLYNNNMSLSINGGINRSGSPGNYTYTTKVNMSNKPVLFIDWFCCARFCNWLHNGKLVSSSTENGSYSLNGSNPNVNKLPGAQYWIPTENEWYKAAFFKNDGTNQYWNYATQSDNTPQFITSNENGDGTGLGLVPFADNQVCPVCLGVGSIEYSSKDSIYLTIIFDYKNFINKHNYINIPEGSIQTICSIDYYSKLKKCSEIIVDTSLVRLTQNIYTRDSEPTPVGLGENKFIFTNWKRKQ